MANSILGTYSETCYIGLTVHNEAGTATVTDARVEALSESVSWSGGEQESEFRPMLNGGRVEVKKPMTDVELEFEGKFMGIGDTDDTTPDGLSALFLGGTDTTVPFTTPTTAATARVRYRYHVFTLFTDDTAASGNATSSIASGGNAVRGRFANCRLVSVTPKFDAEGGLTYSWKFRCPAYTPTGIPNVYWESTDGTASMASLATIAAT